MMRIPESIKVGPFAYDITYESPVLSADNNRLCGRCDHQKLCISIDDELMQAPLARFETFVHEALHAIDHVAQTGLSEETVARLSMMLTAFLLDNGLVPQEAPGATERADG